MDSQIVHRPELCRFELTQNGETAFVEYKKEGNNFTILHTIVPKPIEGQGIAKQLVQTAFDYALAQRLHPAATCWYAKVWLQRHPDYTLSATQE